MKSFKTLFVFCMILLAFSCNKDDDSAVIQPLLGHWHAIKFEPSVSNADNDLVAKAMPLLLQQGCDHPIEFTFRANKTFFGRDGMKNVSVSEDDSGINVSCVSSFEQTEGNFKFDSKKLTLNYDDESNSFPVNVTEEFLSLQVSNFPFGATTITGKLTFQLENHDDE